WEYAPVHGWGWRPTSFPAGCSATPPTGPPLRVRPGQLSAVLSGRPGRPSRPGRLRDDLLRDVLRNFRVGIELHAVASPALGLRPQVPDVAEHLRQRHQRADHA